MKNILEKINKSGQSLVEVVVACGIIGITLVAMMSIVTASKNLLYQSEDQTKATTLAQEGIEIARHQRDVGCSFENIKDDVEGGNTNFVIQGDVDGDNNETLKPSSYGSPIKIPNFGNFSRTIEIEELESNSMDIDTTTDFDCSDPDHYDCANNYYAMRVSIYKDGDSESISQITTIISE